MDALLDWLLRALLLALGAGAAWWLARWTLQAWRSKEERWPFRIALAMLLLAAFYAAGHARLLLSAEQIEAGREAYVRFGDPRRAEQRRAEVRGWILDCSERPDQAFALYREQGGEVERTYPLGQAGANLIGGGEDEGARDYTIERLFAEHLRSPRSLGELGELHPAGTDLSLSLCSGITAAAYDALQATGLDGAVIVQEVQTGALTAYASTGGPADPPLGFQEFRAPGSVWKLALAALWWESGLPQDTVLGCPATIQITPRARIQNFGGRGRGPVRAPAEMLVYSCNTTAVEMAMILRERAGERAFLQAFEDYGFQTYADDEDAPTGFQTQFWRTRSDEWAERMGPVPARLRISPETGAAEWAQLAIGQGPLDVTPMHVSRFLQAIGNGGVMLQPTVELEFVDDPEPLGRIMSERTADLLLAAMQEVVDRGTAAGVQPLLRGLEWDLAGKTGTAQVAGRPDNGWFAGLVLGPDGRPRYTVVVFLEEGGPGGGQPARVAARVTQAFAAAGGAGEVLP